MSWAKRGDGVQRAVFAPAGDVGNGLAGVSPATSRIVQIAI
jgi:hypothetical protein